MLSAEAARQMAAKASATAFALREDAESADDPVPLWERAELCDRLTTLYLAFADDLEGYRTPEESEDAPESPAPDSYG